MRTLLFVVAMLAASIAHAGDIQYNAADGAKAETLRQLAWNTQSCMYDAARVRLAQGERDKDQLAFWMMTTCGRPLFIMMGQTDKAAGMLKRMADYEIDHVPGVSLKVTAAR